MMSVLITHCRVKECVFSHAETEHAHEGTCSKSDSAGIDLLLLDVEDVAGIARQCSGKTYQFDLGGCGTSDHHENFNEILQICRGLQDCPELRSFVSRLRRR